ncbi:MAG: N4-gp56 family major capsid protein [Deltaproteobacteria bacterium]|nr:N4-gp56 family major capsid protein [Deltaproteobacteria bacterium]MBW2081647.1 N4-gp56 family major capsid protein [Deltaproteobacteria bacterium]
MALSSTPTNLVAKQWAKEVFVEGFPNNFFNAYMGDENSPIYVMHDLDKDAGDTVYYGLVMGLDETNGVSGDNVLIGNEESLTIYDDSLSIDQLRNGVRLKGRMDERKARFALRTQAKNQLKAWLPRAIDYHIFRQLAGDTSYNFAGNTGVEADSDHCVVCGDTSWDTDVSTTEGNMDQYDFLTTYEIDKCVEVAKTLEPMIRPFRVDGEDYYLLVIHPYVARNLKYGTDSKWLDAMLYAAERGKNNPIFTGALGIWNNVIVREHRMVQSITSNIYRCLFLGAQACAVAFAEKKIWAEDTTSDQADYGNRPGFAAGFIGGFKKCRFNSKDYGMLTVLAYATAAGGEDHSS